MRGGTCASGSAAAMRAARARSASLPQGSTTGMPSARPSSIQLSSGQSLSSRLVIVRSTRVRRCNAVRGGAAQAVVERHPERIAERRAPQAAVALDGMQAARHGVTHARRSAPRAARARSRASMPWRRPCAQAAISALFRSDCVSMTAS